MIGRHRVDRVHDHQEHLGYDSTERILVSHQAGRSETCAYDAAANLLDSSHQGGLVKHNRLLTYQDKRYRYDALGRLVEKRSASRGLQRFVYDAESRLIEVRNDSGNRIRMTYDPWGVALKSRVWQRWLSVGDDALPLGRAASLAGIQA